MTRKIKILILLCCLFPWMRAVADPIVTTVGSGSICPEDEVVLPVTVSNCNGVAALSLALNYDATKVSYLGYQNMNSAVSTMLVNASGGIIYMTWANMTNVNVGNGTLLELRFKGISGSTNLTWNTSLCEYSNASGTSLQSSYSNGSVNVYAVPSISSHPSNRSIAEGQNTTFEVSASGQGLSYQWQCMTASSHLWENLSNGGHYSNVNSSRLNVNNVNLEMNGSQYRCVVSGTCPSPVTSRAATLSVDVFIPTIVTSVGSVSTCPGTFSVPVTVTNCNNVGAISLALNYNSSLVTYVGYEGAHELFSTGVLRVNAVRGTVYFTWASGNHAINIGNDILISFLFKSESGSSSLSWDLSNCEYSDQAGETLPTSFSGSNLNIYSPPIITTHPTDKTIVEGNSTNFSISASGQGLSYQWQMSQDQGISWETLSNGGHYGNVTTRTLNVNNVVASMDGYRYRCMVSGTCEPSAISNYATLHVEALIPTIVTTAGSINTCSQIEFGIPISVTHCNNVGAISLALAYNTNVMTYTGYEGVNPGLSSGQLQVNAANGMVFIAWASIAGANLGDGNLLTLNFTALSGASSMNWNTAYCEYANPRGVALPASYVNGNVSVAELSFTITTQPTNQTIIMEENATFIIETSGTTTGYQWQVSQDQGSSWSNISADDHYSNTTTNTLSISNVPLDMNGYCYRCAVSGTCGLQYSSVAILTVQLPPNYYEISLSADPIEGGTVEGEGAYEEGTTCTVTATPAMGYNFVNWTENGIEVSQDSAYTFTVAANRELVAHFTFQEIDIVANVNPAGSGTINGAGTYLYGEHVLLTAIPNTGYVFDNWTENGEVVSTNQSISFTAQTDRTLEANFSVLQVNITATPVPASNGSVTGAGTFPYGTTVTLVALANEGFQLDTWTENDSVVSTSDTLTFIAETDRNLVANFIIKQVNVTALVDPAGSGIVSGMGTYNYGDPVVLTATPLGQFQFLNWTENGEEVSMEPTISFTAYNHRNLVAHFFTTITIAATTDPEESGIISGAGTYNYAEPVTLTAVPNTGFSFVNWTENDTLFSTETSISFMAYVNRTFVAHFDSIMHHINVSANNAAAGTVSGGGNYQEGYQATVLAQPNEHYRFLRWMENGTTVSSNANYTFTVWGDRNLVAEFSLVNFEVTATVDPENGGTITGAGFYEEGETCILTAVPNENYIFVNWTKEGIVVSDNTLYSFTVTEDATFVANFTCVSLGEFTYMSPTNNYPFTSLPITFSWDAVSGAEYYDLYVWDAEEQESEEPLALGLRYCNYSTSALQNYHTYNWFVKARNACYEISSSVKSFYLDITPSLNVNVNHIDFGEMAMNQSASTTLNVTGIVLEDELDVQITGEDAAMFSFTQASGWNDYNGGILIVTFNPTTPQYVYNASLVISSGIFTEIITLTGAVSNLYVFSTHVAEDIYAMNSQIPIYGSVIDWNNAPVTDAEVEIGVFVMGMKRTLQAMTDNSGQFSAVFEPMPSESGYYTVNSGRVGNHSTAVHDDFNIPGMAVVTSDYILCAVTQDQPKTDSILIRNKSNLPLSNIQLSTLSAPEGCSFSFSPLNLGGLEEDYLVYTVTGSTLTQGNYYEEVRLKATSNEGAEMVITIWYYCMEPRGVLDVAPQSLVTTMTKGKSKIVDVILTNNGTGATGNIFIDLPDVEWMSVVGNDTLPSLAVNDTAYFSLRFSPDNDIPLVQYSGTIAINSERGDAVGLPYTIIAVSDSTGMFVIDVTDDYTWNTNNGNGPHLEGAEVTLKGYYSLETVAQGYTDANGIFQVDNLPEGYYRLHVEADHHSQYDNNILITAGETNHQNIYLQYQAITYSWTVEPTEIEDEYTYELNVVFETHVPVPVITIEHSGIHDLEYGESANFNLIITNHGLINAFDTHIYFTESSEYTFIPLYDVIDTLSALTTVVIPGTYYRTENRFRPSDDNCDLHCRTVSIYYCNNNGQMTALLKSRSKPFSLGSYESCYPKQTEIIELILPLEVVIPEPWIPIIHECFECIPINIEPQTTEQKSCTPCLEALLKAPLSCLPIPTKICVPLSVFVSTLFQFEYRDLIDIASCFIKKNTLSKINCLYGIFNLFSCVEIDIMKNNSDFIQNTINGLYYSSLYYANELSLIKSFIVEDVWDEEDNIVEFFDEVIALTDATTGFINENDAQLLASTFVGTSVTYDDIIVFINRWNRSVEYWSNGYYMISDLPTGYDTNFIQIDTNMINQMLEIEDYYASIGYDSMSDLYEESVQNATIIASNASQSSVCASVKVRFSQNMTMTREAFAGTFTVHNGHDSEPMEAIGLDFIIKDEDGNICNNLFQINTLSLNNLTEINGSGSLGASLDGVAKIQFIPTKYAATTEPKVYYFGGIFSFIDPYTSEDITVDLYPVEITVNPSPDLYVDYFMQRDILGDDALTLDVVEPSIPAELGVIIHNQGAGMAKNVILETAEPEIIDNEKGLAIDFAMYGASFNGSPRQLGLMEIPFGNIGSGQTAVGEWLFTSSLLGHFVSYEAHVIHNSSYGNPDLSLVSHLDIHELIHPIYAYGNLDDGINDFLVNDNPDAYDTPDSIYFSHGGRTAVGIDDNISFDHYVEPQDTVVILTINPSRIGWNYGVTEDPGRDNYNLVSCTRNYDGQVIPLNNVWQTFVTIPDGGDPVYENKLHIVDTLSNDVQDFTYTLVYSLKNNLLDVSEITGIPENSIDYPLENFTVRFNEAIIDSTFTYEDMTLKCQNGSNLMDSTIVITKVNDSIYDVNISGLTNETGLYVLNVSTLSIKDLKGYSGNKGKQATWVQVLENYTQTMNLTIGWNWWSTYIEQSNIDGLSMLENSLGHKGVTIKSQFDFVQNFYSDYGEDVWFGSLEGLANEQGYMIDVTEDCISEMRGVRTQPTSHPITLQPNWNWIGYPVDSRQGIASALAGFNASPDDLIKSHFEFSTYYEGFGWFPDDLVMTPGEGYFYYSNADESQVLTYNNVDRGEILPEKSDQRLWKTNVHAFADNLSIMAVVSVDSVEQRDENLELGAFVNGECRGSARLKHFGLSDRYYAMLSVAGQEGDKVDFGFINKEKSQGSMISENHITFVRNGIMGSLDAPYIVKFNTSTEVWQGSMVLFPNPVERNKTFNLDIPKNEMLKEIIIVDMLGEEVLRKTGALKSNEIAGLPVAGIYVVKAITESGNVYHGRLIVK